MATTNLTTEQHRAKCEARYWLKATGGKPAEVQALLVRIKKKRGKAAANRLIQDMRQQWKQENHHG